MTTEFAHEALLYAGDDGFVPGALPFVLEGLEAGEPILLVLSADKIKRIRGEVNGNKEGILFADMAEVGSNPARMLSASVTRSCSTSPSQATRTSGCCAHTTPSRWTTQ